MATLNGKTLRINSADVAFEVIDGEVIAIDFSRGCYYNLAGGGVRIWEELGYGVTAEEIATAFEADAEQRGEIDAFLALMLDEELIIAEDAPSGPSTAVGGRDPSEYVPPRFEKYDDMQDFFVLDPIHDVDASGWPKPKPD